MLTSFGGVCTVEFCPGELATTVECAWAAGVTSNVVTEGAATAVSKSAATGAAIRRRLRQAEDGSGDIRMYSLWPAATHSERDGRRDVSALTLVRRFQSVLRPCGVRVEDVHSAVA